MAEFEALIAGARLPEQGVPICMRGDLNVQHADLEERLSEAREAARRDNSLTAGGGESRKLAEEIEALQAEMRQHTHTFILRGLPRQKFRDLVEAHPPREDNRDDATMGVNVATFPAVLISASCIDPPMTVEQVEQLCEVLTEGQVLELYGAALALNRISVDVPKSVIASETLAKLGPRSQPPAHGASAADGFSGGSLAG